MTYVLVLKGRCDETNRNETNLYRKSVCIWPVSYTHLDVYKRQLFDDVNFRMEQFTVTDRRGKTAIEKIVG